LGGKRKKKKKKKQKTNKQKGDEARGLFSQGKTRHAGCATWDFCGC
jgi:hypothetical protein